MLSIDCFVVVDLLNLWVVFVVGKCDFIDMCIDNQDVMFKFGVYCNGLIIKDNLCVWMMYGIYIMKDGDLCVQGNLSLIMVDVVVYLIGYNV